MEFAEKDLNRLERLAALRLAPAERERMRADLERILEYVRALQKLDVAGIPPTFHVIDARPVLRPDEVQASLPAAEALGNAPDARGGFYRVPRFVGGDESPGRAEGAPGDKEPAGGGES